MATDDPVAEPRECGSGDAERSTADFHAGVVILRDTLVAELEDEPTVEWVDERRLALVGLPEVRLALDEAGFVDVETYSDLDATTPGRVRGRRLLVVARAP